MKPIQYYIGILSVLGYVYCLPVVGQVEDKVVRKGNPRLEYTDVKTGRSPEGKMFTVSFNIVESINRLRTQEIVYIYPSLVSSDGNIRTAFSPLCISGKKRYKVVARKERLGGNPGTLLPATGGNEVFFAVAQARSDTHAGRYLLNSIDGPAGWTSASNTNATYRRCMTYSVRPVIDPDVQEDYKKYLPE